MFDTYTVFSSAGILAFLSAAIFGSTYRCMPHALRSSVRDWCIGTFLLAACSTAFALLANHPTSLVRFAGNSFWLLGVTFYWRSVRRFFGAADTPMVFLAAVVGMFVTLTFTIVIPHFAVRVALATVLSIAPLALATVTLLTHRAQVRSISGLILTGIFLTAICLLIVRGFYFHDSRMNGASMLTAANLWVSIVPVLLCALPIVGTTAFAVLCLERVRRDASLSPRVDPSPATANRDAIA